MFFFFKKDNNGLSLVTRINLQIHGFQSVFNHIEILYEYFENRKKSSKIKIVTIIFIA